MPKSPLRKSKASGSTLRRIDRLVATGYKLTMQTSPADWLHPRRISPHNSLFDLLKARGA
jgi:hypothetical protein